MPELIARGHIYIAVPPLYKVKLGQQDYYFEKDAQLEDLLARERIPQVVVTDRTGAEVKFTGGSAGARLYEGDHARSTRGTRHAAPGRTSGSPRSS